MKNKTLDFKFHLGFIAYIIIKIIDYFFYNLVYVTPF